jgi:hypothetical protein
MHLRAIFNSRKSSSVPFPFPHKESDATETAREITHLFSPPSAVAPRRTENIFAQRAKRRKGERGEIEIARGRNVFLRADCSPAADQLWPVGI